ncbi:MAG: nucleotide exchange factor GrpE [Chloroflexota bacterium]
MNDSTPTNGAAHDEPPTPAGDAASNRTKTRAEERIEALDTSASGLMEQIAELQVRAEVAEAETEAVRADLESVRGQWQRTQADFMNYKRRSEEERYAGQASATEALLRKTLGVADDLGRALEHVPTDQQASPWVEGVAAIERKLQAALESEGVTAIVAVGAVFDPRLHEAVSMEPTGEVAEGTVTRELQRGYQLRDRVLRPALVVVATPPTN